MSKKLQLAKEKKSLQKMYLNDVLLKRADGYEKIIKEIIKEIPNDFNKVETIATDSFMSDLVSSMNKKIKKFNSIFTSAALSKSVTRFIGNKVAAKNKAAYKQFIKSNKSVQSSLNKIKLDKDLSMEDMIDNENLQNFTKDAIVQNVELIKSMDTKAFEDIKTTLYQNVTGKIDKKVLSEKLLELGAKNKTKAKQIAIDQTNKITENMNNQRSQALGAVEFEWITTGKNTVRSEHASFDEKIFSYKDGAGSRGILPGQDVNCQCTAIPIFKDGE
jgi:SPP1 gp7 family putative phage head morphogenesis protein